MDINNSSSLEQKIGLFGTLWYYSFIPFIIQMNILPCWKNFRQSRSIRILADFTADCGSLLPLQSERNVSFSSFLFLTSLHSLRWKYCRNSENGIAFFDDMTLEICSLFHLGAGKMLICKNDLCTLSDEEKKSVSRLTLKQICLFSEPARSCFFTKHSAVQAESYLSENAG